MFEIQVKTNADRVARWFANFHRKQIPFATAAALTGTALDARDEQREEMRNRFEIRSQRVVRGIQIRRAEKRDWPDPFALVGTKDAFMVPHERGGTFAPDRNRTWAIPTKLAMRQRTATGRIRARWRPSRLISTGQGYVADDSGSTRIQVRRAARGMGGLQTAYLLRRRKRLDARLKLHETVEAVVRKRYAKQFQKWLARASRSAR